MIKKQYIPSDNTINYRTNVLKIPKSLPGLFINRFSECGKFKQDKKEVGKNTGKSYQTNSELPALGTFIVLKSLTKSGKIQNYKDQLEKLCILSKCEKQSFLKRLAICQRLKLLTYDKNNIYLNSWRSIQDQLQVNKHHKGKYYIVNLIQNDKTKPHHLLTALEKRHNEEIQEKWVTKKISENPRLDIAVKKNRLAGESRVTCLRRLQLSILTKKTGSEDMKYLYQINCDLERTARTICRAHGYKTFRSVHDLKKRLVKLGLITLCRRIRRGNGEWNGKRFSKYFADTKTRETMLPDQITLNPKIFLN